MTDQQKKELYNLVYKWPTKYKQGFLPNELNDILAKFPYINMDKFNDAMMGNTCGVEENKPVCYHCDVELALRCGLENREPQTREWD